MIQLAQILFILSVLVILHEFGHFIAARIFKVRVEKFYLFMDAGFSLFKKKIGETEWGIGWLPIGGYVKLSGMIDESLDTAQMNEEPQPWEFRSKPAWQRLIIMLGGIIVNLLLAWFIYTSIFATVGQKYISTEAIQKNGLAFGEVGKSVGFQNGDKIVSVDGSLQEKFNWLIIDVLLSDKVILDRNGKKIDLVLTDEQKGEILGKEGKGFIKARTEINKMYIDSINNKNKTLFQKGDIVTSINNFKVTYFDQFTDSIKKNKNKTIAIAVVRDNKELILNTAVDKNGSIGIAESLFFHQLTPIKDAYIEEVVNQENKALLPNDKIIGINGVRLNYYHEFYNNIKKYKNQTISLTVLRNNKELPIDVKVNEKSKIGIKFNAKESNLKIVKKHTIGSAIPAAVKESWQLFVYNIKQFKLILKPATGAYKQVKSPVGIARQLPDFWDWEFIWNFTALFSIGLAFMNLLPIPGLDGGHALFTIAEMVTGRKLTDKTMGYVQTGGMIILLSLMALTFGKDIYQLIADKLF
jgi:RIP metalloprotease RseP